MKLKNNFWWILLIFLVCLIIWFFKFSNNYPKEKDLVYKENYFGVTYSIKIAKELALDWRESYIKILDELLVKDIRLPIYWDQIEKHQGQFDFSDYDWILDEGAKKDVRFIVNVGYRLPRWPECHAPAWGIAQSSNERQDSILNMIEEVINRYKDRAEISSWQIENEPFLNAFGECPDSDHEFLEKEVELVRRLDNRPIVISASGELSFWKKESKISDIFGTTLYRVVWGPNTNYVRYPIPYWFYKLKANLVGIAQKDRIISELQAEPWVPEGSLKNLSNEEAKKSFNLDQFKANVQYAIKVDFSKAYLWGVEWWYFKKQNGQSEYWDFAKTLFNK